MKDSADHTNSGRNPTFWADFMAFFVFFGIIRVDGPGVSEEIGVPTESLLRNPGPRVSDFLSKDFLRNNRTVLDVS